MPSGENYTFFNRGSVYPILELLYETLDKPNLWVEALGAVAKTVSAPQSAMIFHDARCGDAAVRLSTGIPPDALTQYGSHYGLLDAWFARSAHLTAGWSGVGDELISEHEMQQTEFYNDFLRPHNMRHQCGIVLLKDQSRFSTLTFLRGKEGRSFGQREMEYLQLLAPHFRRVLDLRTRLCRLEQGISGLLAGFQAFDQAVFGLTANGSISLMNAKADALVKAGNQFYLKNKHLRLRSAKEDSKLQALVRSIADRGLCAVATAGSALLAHDSNGTGLQIIVMPLFSNPEATMNALSALIFVNTPIARTVSRLAILRILYELTPAEGRLVDLLADGETMRSIAQKLTISHETALSPAERI